MQKKIAIVGSGGIGSTFAVQLARAGHEVTVVARGKRLAQLQERAGVATADGDVVSVTLSEALDPAVPYDLVLVSVLAHQVAPLLSALTSSSARRIMFMFNTFEPLQPLQAAVGAERFAFGFPSIMAGIDAQGRLQSSIQSRGMLTTVTDQGLAEVFSAAGIPAVVSTQMESWLRCHAAVVVPFILASAKAQARHAGITWREAIELAQAIEEGFDLVRELGHAVTPRPVSVIDRLPASAKAAILWSATRSEPIRTNGAAAVREAHHLIAAMLAAAPSALPLLERLRPAASA
jgi:2-dehydropantoate 2-reductase